jgi:hypothetical protein
MRFQPSQYSEGEEKTPLDPNAALQAGSSLASLLGAFAPMIGQKGRNEREMQLYAAQSQASMAAAQIEAQKAARTAQIVKGVVGVTLIVGVVVVGMWAVKSAFKEGVEGAPA